MTDDDRLQSLLRSTLPRASGHAPSRDCWPLIVTRIRAPMERSWLDIGLAAIVAILLMAFPEWLFWLAYHL